MKEIKTILFVFYSLAKEEDKNFPSFLLKEDTAFQCNKENISIRFLPLDIERKWEEMSFPENKDICIKVFSHGIKEQNEYLSHQIHSDVRVYVHVDYSRGDPSYEQMWVEIRDAKNCLELAEILEYWMKSYVVDPLRRIKHRAINLFMSLSTDIQFLLEIWRRKDFVMAKTHLAELKTEWENKISPVTYLYRLWYMVVGNALDWGKESLPGMPSDVVSLPKDESGKELSLYEWLNKYLIKEFPAWEKLLAHVQLDPVDPVKKEKKINVSGGNGVHYFFKMLEKETRNLEKIVPGKKVKGFLTDKTIQDEFNEFLKWLNDLNDAFEDVIKKCQKES